MNETHDRQNFGGVYITSPVPTPLENIQWAYAPPSTVVPQPLALGQVCPHGSLARSCDPCHAMREAADLRAQLAAANEREVQATVKLCEAVNALSTERYKLQQQLAAATTARDLLRAECGAWRARDDADGVDCIPAFRELKAARAATDAAGAMWGG